MFRKRYQASGGGLDLPTTSGNAPAPSVFNLGMSKKGTDGSAKSIHLQNPVVTKWKRSSKGVKVSYSIALISFLVTIMGWRTITYYSAKINIECTTTDCTFSVRGTGRGPVVKLTVPRHQVLGSKAVKVNKEGKVVNGNVNVNEEWKYESSSKKKKNANSNSYKGPDKDGNYLTYVVLLKDKDPAEKAKDTDNNNSTEKSEQFEEQPSVALASIMDFIVTGGEKNEDLHLVMRQHGISQNRRRVRNMIQKVDSYAKKRRHKLSVKESTSPDWRGVLMMVLGGCVCLLSFLLGMFWEDEETHVPGGPGARSHKKQNSHAPPNPQSVNPYQRATPSRYEVSTMPKKTKTISSTRKK